MDEEQQTMTRGKASLTGAFVVSVALAWTGMASAEPLNVAALGAGYSAADAPLGSPTELRIDLRGEVPARCEVTPPSSLGRIRLNEAGEARGAFDIDCNTPFRLRVRSQNGGLASVQPLSGVAQRADYRLGVEVGTDKGRQDLGWCLSPELAPEAGGSCAFGSNANGGWSSGEATAINQSGVLRLRWEGQDAGPPRLGAYQDNIVIEVEVRS